MPTTPPAITAPGLSPDPTDRATYNSRAYAWMQWLKDHAVPEIYADALNCYNNAVEAAASAIAATSAVSGIGASVTAAGTSASNAAASETAALASLNAFKGTYYGAYASDPSTDPLGAAKTAGDLYYNTAVPEMRVWNGSAWVAGYLPTAGFATLAGTETLSGKTLTTPVINGFTGSTAAINIGSGQIVKDPVGNVGFGVTPNAWLSSKAIDLSGGGLTASLYATSTGICGLTNNFYYTGSSLFAGTGYASSYYQYQGQHVWRTSSASGTAGGAITWAPVMVADANGIGYPTGAGGTVTQATSKSTAVTLNKPTGKITLNGASLADGATVSFQLNNSLIVAGDTVSLSLFSSTATLGAYRFWIDRVDVGSTHIFVQNYSGGALAEAFSIQFNVHKGATS